MKATLTKELINKKRRNILTLQLEEIDEFTIRNFQDELDLEMYLAEVSIDNVSEGKFLVVSKENGKEIEHKMFYRNDYETIKNKIDFGVYDKNSFINLLEKRCPQLFDNKRKDKVKHLAEILDEETIIKNFRNIYNSIREYSIVRLEEYQKPKTKIK